MKIVSLFPAGSEIICNLGLSKNLIAVSHECDFPPLLSKKPKVTKSIIPKSNDQKMIDRLVKNAIKNDVSLYQIDNNSLLKMNPDLIITQGLCEVCSISENQIQATLKNNLCTLSNKTKIMSLNATTFDEICEDIIMIGKEVNKVKTAKNLVKQAYQRKNDLLQKN
jgi:ABC-type Fe3+-hydroxamate transport system, periplasmic component